MVTMTGTGGLTQYQYKLTGGSKQVSGNLTPLMAGTYTITVQNANNCTVYVLVTIIHPASALTGSIISQTNALCSASASGSVIVAGAGGISPFKFSLNGAAFQAAGMFSALAAGTYPIAVMDANLCSINVPVTVTELTVLSISAL